MLGGLGDILIVLDAIKVKGFINLPLEEMKQYINKLCEEG
jgi:hypothetical protein